MPTDSTDTTNRMFDQIVDMVTTNSTVLDVGCGNGDLLELLNKERNVRARGLEISRSGVSACVARGLSVVQGDANTDLADYPDLSFDFVILTQTIQAMERPLDVLNHSLRIGRHVIVSVLNFAHWRLRLSLLLKGRMPKSQTLPTAWYQTDNIHLCTIEDFISLCDHESIDLDKAWAGGTTRLPKPFVPAGPGKSMANWRAEEALFLLKRSD